MVSEADKQLINTGKCNAEGCNANRCFRRNNWITPVCSKQECRKKWQDAGKQYTESESCHHVTLSCPHLTEASIDKLKAEFGYEHQFNSWANAATILLARKTIFGKVKPQHMQNGSAMYAYAHGKASIGSIQRPVYFDLGGTYDLLDDMHYEELIKSIEDGDVKGAQVITPEDLGHTPRGVPVDLAYSTSPTGSSIAWVKRWFRITVEVTTKAGRKFILTQANIGFVRRSTPLLILGKKTCTLWGYRTIKQRDSDRRDEDETKHRKSAGAVKPSGVSPSTTTAEGTKNSTTSTSTPTECEDTLQIQVLHDDGKMMLGGQYLQIAASDIPLQCMSDYVEDFSDQKNDNKDFHDYDNNNYKHNNKSKNKSHWSWTDKTHTRRAGRQTDVTAKSQNVQDSLLGKTLAAAGKNDQGDNDAEASDEIVDEEDDDVHPASRIFNHAISLA